MALCVVSALPLAQLAEEELVEAKSTTTPVPILKSINQVNEDGSYTFGYEAGDGSFRIEKKELDGHIQGIYIHPVNYRSVFFYSLHSYFTQANTATLMSSAFSKFSVRRH